MNIFSFSYYDAIDILLVAMIIYQIILIIKDTRIIPMLVGLLILFLLFISAKMFDLQTLDWILSYTKNVAIIIFFILFQNDIRKGLSNISLNSPMMRFFSIKKQKFQIDEIIDSVMYFKERRIGALIVFQRKSGLSNILKSGVVLNSDISSHLLKTIFAPNTELHDGAVVIKNGRIVSAKCYLPLSESDEFTQKHGTRHLAGIGITEETDAVALIVSEERGYISIAHEGRLEYNLTIEQLKTMLQDLLAL